MADEQKLIAVDGDITPISKEEVRAIDSSQWTNLNVMQLYEQLSILQDRLIIAHNMKNPALINYLQKGIANIQAVIASKSGTTGIL